MDGWDKSEKTLLLVGVITIAIVLVGIMVLFVVVPMIHESIRNGENIARELKENDDNILLPPTGNDLKIVGKWCDAVQYSWTGKVIDIYEFKADGTYFSNVGSRSPGKGTWGRLKGNNKLVTRYLGRTTGGSDLKFDSSGARLSIDSLYNVRVPA